MLNLYDELIALIRALNDAGIEYAVCGGMAMAIHSFPRHTVDLDLLILPDDVERVFAIAEGLGYTFRARPMNFHEGLVQIRRITKIDPETHDPLMLDLLLVTPGMQDVWDSRQTAITEDATLTVVSPEGLIKMKSARGSGRDLDDIAVLRGDVQ